MNFLGHLTLAWPHKDLMVGGFLGDFVKGDLNSTRLQNEYSPPILAGIRLHRRIDARSDCHPSITLLKKELPENWKRYTGILADLYCDHLIATQDNKWLPVPIADFANQSYSLLTAESSCLNERAQYVLDRMQKGQWLENYADIDFTARSLQRIGQRLRFDNPFAESPDIINQYANSLNHHCHNLYADMQQVVAEWLTEESYSNL